MIHLYCAFTFLLLFGALAYGETTYQYRDEQGGVVLSSEPLDSTHLTLVTVWKPWTPPQNRYKDSAENRQALLPIIKAAAKESGLPFALLDAVISVESSYDSNAISPAGAVGLMQLMPTVIKQCRITNSNDPVENTRCGSQYLAQLLRQYDGDVSLALAAYNAGEQAVQQFQGVPPYKETRNYITRILKKYLNYQYN